MILSAEQTIEVIEQLDRIRDAVQAGHAAGAVDAIDVLVCHFVTHGDIGLCDNCSGWFPADLLSARDLCGTCEAGAIDLLERRKDDHDERRADEAREDK